MQKNGLKGSELSPLQERLWSYSGTSGIYRAQYAFHVNGILYGAALKKALQEMVETYEILRTVFYALPGMDLPAQVITPCPQIYCPIINLEGVVSSLQENILTNTFKLLLQEPFDLEHGPLLRTILYRLSPEKHQVLFSMPALCADAATFPQLVADLFQRYEPCCQKQLMDEEPLQYIDVSAWQSELLEAENAKTPYAFWSRIDLSPIQQMSLPLSRVEEHTSERMGYESFKPEVIAVLVDQVLSTHLQELERGYNVSRAAFLLACWQVLLWRLTGDADQIVGVAGDGRIYEELTDVIGLYTRFVPVNTHIVQTQTFEQVLTLVSQSLERAMQWQSYFSWPPAQNTVAGGTVARYFPVSFECEHVPETFSCGPLTVSLLQRFICIEPFSLKLSVLCSGPLLQLELHYDSQHFTREEAQHLISALGTLLRDVVAQPDAPIWALRIVEPFEQARLLKMFQAPHLPLITHELHHLFEECVRRTPNKLALQSSDEQLTYQELNGCANQLARVLRRRGVAPNVLVGLYLPRSAQMIVVMLAIFKAGGAYVPLDPDTPQERLAYQLQDAQPAFLLTQPAFLSQLPSWDGEPLSVEALRLEATQEDSSNLSLHYPLDHLAYVIYTSGSTGVPKGVMIYQSNMLNYTQALCDLLHIEPGWQFATVSTLAADLGNTAIFCALASGGCLQVLDYATITSSENFVQWVANHPIDVLKIVPSHLSVLLEGNPLKEMLPRRALVLGGEALPVSLVQQIQDLQGNCTVYNHYGPTETTIGVLVNELGSWQSSHADRTSEKKFRSIPLGKPLASTAVYVLDRWMQVVPEGVIGELYIGGSGLANGYLHQPEQTAERFIPHPWSEKEGARLYRTGDLVRCEQGQIEFIGRSDSQVKLRGYRVELGEIEILLKRHPQVRDSVVMFREDHPGGACLVGYIVARKQPGPASKELCDYLRAYVPEYMVPLIFVSLKTLPLTANGKLDRQWLTSAYVDEGSQISSVISPDRETKVSIPPRDMVEFRLLRIWEEILQVRPISVLDNFFDLGGHSILAVRLMSQIFRQFEQDLALTTLFQRPTIAELAIALRPGIGDVDQSVLVAIQTQGSRLPFFCVHPSGGTVFSYVNLARYLGPDQPFYGLQTTDISAMGHVVSSLEDLASHYVTAIRAAQPQGPYLLGGWSMGGVVAFEIAQHLRRQGQTIALLAIIDSTLVDPHTRIGDGEEKADYTDEEIVKEEISDYNIPVPPGFYQLNIEQQKKYALEKAKEMQLLHPDIGFEQIRRIFRTAKAHRRLAYLYTAQQYPYRIDYFQAGNATRCEQLVEDAENLPNPSVVSDPLGLWREVASGGFEIHFIPGEHSALMQEPHVKAVAVSLKQCIDRVCEEIS